MVHDNIEEEHNRAKKFCMTAEGYRSLEEELSYLRTVRGMKFPKRSALPEALETFPKTASMMRRKTSRQLWKLYHTVEEQLNKAEFCPLRYGKGYCLHWECRQTGMWSSMIRWNTESLPLGIQCDHEHHHR
jgi:hypothetical protein